MLRVRVPCILAIYYSSLYIRLNIVLRFWSWSITGAAGLRIDISRHEVHVGAHLLALTKTEFNILEALASVKGRVVTQQRLLAAAWPNKATPDPLLLKPHVARLRSKLEEAGGPLPESVRGVGYRLGAS